MKNITESYYHLKNQTIENSWWWHCKHINMTQ